MKIKLLLLVFLFFISVSLKAQFVNFVHINDFEAEYLQMTKRQKSGTKIYLLIDYGQPTILDATAESFLRDSTGKRMEFNSFVDGLNFMNKYGYELIHPYGTLNDSFLMRRKKTDI